MRALRVYIINEGGEKIGLGHIMRCVALRQAFEKARIDPIFIVNGDKSLKKYLKSKDITLNWIKKPKNLFDIIRGADVAIVDSYLADYGMYETISSMVKIPVYLDDNKRIIYPRGIVINFTGYAERLKYPKSPGIIYCLGKKYTLLRKAFWSKNLKKINKNVKKILITFGGSDPDGMTIITLQVLCKEYPGINKIVAVGEAFAQKGKILKMGDKNTRFVLGADADKMKELFMEADLLISSAGQTLFEASAVGVPTIAISIVDNQLANFKDWIGSGFFGIDYLRDSKNFKIILRDKIKLLEQYGKREKYARKLRSRSDPLGAINVVDLLLGYLSRWITTRPCRKFDCRDLWLWRNDEKVRRRCFSKSAIRYSDHEWWFNNKLNDNKAKIYIAEGERGYRLGQIRFERRKKTAFVNVNINPDFLGRGYGNQIIKHGTWTYLAENPMVKKITAKIEYDNRISKKAFEIAGYRPKRDVLTNKRIISLYEYIR